MRPVEDHWLRMAAFALGDLVFVVREDEIEPAAVDVESFAEDFFAHGRALNVPARTPCAPRAFPRRLAGLGRLPKSEIGHVAFAGGCFAPLALHRVDRAVGEFAVVRVFADVEIHVAVRDVGEAAFDEAVDELNDLRHALGGAREHVDLVDAQRGQVLVVVGDVFLGHVEHRDAALVCLLDKLIIDVRDVHNPGDVVAVVNKVALDAVEDDWANHVADVSFVVDRRSAQIDADFAGPHGCKRLLAFRESVVDANCGMRGGDFGLCRLGLRRGAHRRFRIARRGG